ncbi:MAG TPA: hypothetical protein VF903_04470 [Nitrospirota bacterium]
MKKPLVLLIIVVLSFPLMSYGLSLSGKGSATIDGVMSPGEWDNAAKYDFQVNVPSSLGGGTAPASLYVMNDGINLYLGLKLTQPSFGTKTALTIEFDNNNNGILDNGEDVIMMQAGTNPPMAPTFYDEYGFTTAAGVRTVLQDTDPSGISPAGTNDVIGAASNDGTVTTVEISHLLCSKDTLHDVCLKPGATVGFRATIRLYGTTSTSSFGTPAGPTPTPYADTVIPSLSGFGQIVIPQAVVTRVIDIKPGSTVNSINRKSEGKIPVAILSTADWSAPANVDRHSLTFGHDGMEASLAFCDDASQDVNGDGFPDLVCHFSTQLAGFQMGDTVGILNGKTKNGGAFTAKDSVRIVK